MAYTLTVPVILPSAYTGLTLRAQLFDDAGANVGGAVTSGFIERGSSGTYLWTGTIPDSHQGGVDFSNNADGVLLASTAINPADAGLDDIVEGSTTQRQSHRLANAANGGKTSGMETTAAAIRDLADSKDRVTATVDRHGNRSSVTLDLA